MVLKKERKLNRWQWYDYKYPGLYFVTICTNGRQSMFGKVIDYEMKLNEIGEIAKQQLIWLHDHFSHVRLDEWMVMPNHVHAILEINYNFDDNKTGYADEIMGTGLDGKIFEKSNTVGNVCSGLIFDNCGNVGTGRDRKIFGTPHNVGNVLERSLHNPNNP